VTEKVLDGAGHQADFDRPNDLAAMIDDYLRIST
jgi:hypothetical protein